jgi:hypothetical protein
MLQTRRAVTANTQMLFRSWLLKGACRQRTLNVLLPTLIRCLATRAEMAVAAAALPSARVAASKLLQQIVSAVEPLKELNEGFSCLVSDGEIVIHSGAASGA